MPASVLWEKGISPQLNVRQLGVDVQKIVGTIWDGQVLVSYHGLSAIVDWDIKLAHLLSFRVPVDLRLNSQAGEAEARLNLSLKSLELKVNTAQFDLKSLTPMFRAQRVTLDGELFIKNILLRVENERLIAASGMASWSGGDIAYPAGREVHERTLPMFRANIETKTNGEIYLGIRDSQATFDVIESSLAEDGTGLLKITRRLLDLSNEPWSLNSREQDVVFKVKKMLY